MTVEQIKQLISAVAGAADQASALMAVETAVDEYAAEAEETAGKLAQAEADNQKLRDTNMSLYLRVTNQGEGDEQTDDEKFVEEFEAKFADFRDEEDDNG